MNNTNNTPNKPTQKKKKPTSKKKTQAQQKKRSTKLTRAQYDDLRQIEWIPFDPYAD